MRVGAVLSGAALLCGLAACSSGSHHNGTSHAAIVSAAHQAQKNSRSCPLHIDVTQALKKAGVSGTAKPYSQDGESAASGTVATPSSTLPPLQAQEIAGESALAVGDGAETDCTYQLSQSTVDVEVIDVRRGTAVNLMAPEIMKDAQYSVTQLSHTLPTLDHAAYGDPTVLGSPGIVAVVRLRTTDKTSAALLINSAVDRLRGSQLKAAARTVAAQITSAPVPNLR